MKGEWGSILHPRIRHRVTCLLSGQPGKLTLRGKVGTEREKRVRKAGLALAAVREWACRPVLNDTLG